MVIYWLSCNVGVKDKGGTGGSWRDKCAQSMLGLGIGSLGREDRDVLMTSVAHVL